MLRTGYVVRNVTPWFLVLVLALGTRGLLHCQVPQVPKCSIVGPIEGQEEVAGTVGPEAVKVKVTVSNPDSKKVIHLVETDLLLADKKFRVSTPPLKVDQIVDVQGIKGNGSPAQSCGPIAVQAKHDTRDYEWYQTLIPPRRAADMFGRRIAKNYIAIQVTVVNKHKELDLIIYDVEVDHSEVLKNENCSSHKLDKTSLGERLHFPCESSSQELSVLRGVSEKGQVHSPRNAILRALRGVGTIASSLAAITTFGPAWSPAVAAFNGAGLTAYGHVFPDFTINQLNRLNDSAYAANAVVSSKSSRVFVAFIPIDLFLSADDKKKYWKRPHDFFSETAKTGKPDFSQFRVLVAAEHVVRRSEIQPQVEEVNISKEQKAEPKAEPTAEQKAEPTANFLEKGTVSGHIVGRFLENATLALQEAEELGLTIELDDSRESTNDRLYFVITPSKILPPNQLVLFQVVRGDLTTTHGERLTLF